MNRTRPGWDLNSTTDGTQSASSRLPALPTRCRLAGNPSGGRTLWIWLERGCFGPHTVKVARDKLVYVNHVFDDNIQSVFSVEEIMALTSFLFVKVAQCPNRVVAVIWEQPPSRNDERQYFNECQREKQTKEQFRIRLFSNENPSLKKYYLDA